MADPFTSPYVPSIYQSPNTIPIAQLIGQQGQQAAEAQRRGGEIAGQMWSNSGQTIAQAPTQYAQAKRAVQEEKARATEQQTADLTLKQRQRSIADLETAQKMVGQFIGDDGLPDLAGLSKALAAQNIGLDVQNPILSHAKDLYDIGVKSRDDRRNNQADVANAMIGMIDKGMDPWTAVAAGTTIARNHHIANDKEIAQLTAQLIQAPDAAGMRSVLETIRQMSGKYVPKVEKVGKDEILGTVDPSTGKFTQTATGIKSAPTAEQVSIDSFMDAMRIPRGTAWEALPPSIRAQYPQWKAAQEMQAGSVEDWVTRAVQIATESKGGPLTIQEQQATTGKALQMYREINADPAMRDANLALKAAVLKGHDVDDPVYQGRLEAQYRQQAAAVRSNRSGGLGLEDMKVDQGIHLMTILDQAYDPKTGKYNIKQIPLVELALGLARMTSSTGQVGIQMEQEVMQATLAGDIAKAATYVFGTPVTATSQDVVKMYHDSIERQTQVAEQNRGHYVDMLKMLAPYDLAPERRAPIDAALDNLPSLATRKSAAKPETATLPPVPKGKMRIWKVDDPKKFGLVPEGNVPDGWTATQPK